MKNTGMDKGCVKIKAYKITAHMTADEYDLATLAADCCQLTDSQFGAAVIKAVSRLVLMRSRYGWRRVLRPDWWRLLKGML